MAGELAGMVDVLQLTCATLERIKEIDASGCEGNPLDMFFSSLETDTESIASTEGSRRADSRMLMSPDLSRSQRGDSVLPSDSASHHGAESPEYSTVDSYYPHNLFPFKFKSPAGRNHRIQVNISAGIAELVEAVAQKLGSEADSIGGVPQVESGRCSTTGFALSYMDNENDIVSITTDHDLISAVTLARQYGSDKVLLYVHDPAVPPEPPLPAGIVPATVSASVTPAPLSTTHSNVHTATEPTPRQPDFDQQVQAKADTPAAAASTTTGTGKSRVPLPSAQHDQIIPNVPNELLLPGAIAGLAAVILGVFAISRLSQR